MLEVDRIYNIDGHQLKLKLIHTEMDYGTSPHISYEFEEVFPVLETSFTREMECAPINQTDRITLDINADDLARVYDKIPDSFLRWNDYTFEKVNKTAEINKKEWESLVTEYE